jgi:hypothetical protein
MKVWYPESLNDLDGTTVMRELFGEDPSTAWWSLKRVSTGAFDWEDRRLNLNWTVTHGYLVSLHEVSTPAQAQLFAKKNKIHLFDDGGFYFRNVLEINIRCNGLSPPPGLISEGDLYRISTKNGIEAYVGYASMLFQRLVARPAVEVNERLPDPETLTTLVVKGVDRSEMHAAAEIVLYHLRVQFPGVSFEFWPLPQLHLAPPLNEAEDTSVSPRLAESLYETSRPEAIAFFNRAQEAEPIQSFLYFYRVLEACFEDVLDQEVRSWRADLTVDTVQLLKNVRSLQQKEDIWALRRVLGKIVDQPMLDSAHAQGLISEASAEALTQAVYLRRNSIAHGRRGQHQEVLVPFGFSLVGDGQHRLWRDLLEKLATKALNMWLLGN